LSAQSCGSDPNCNWTLRGCVRRSGVASGDAIYAGPSYSPVVPYYSEPEVTIPQVATPEVALPEEVVGGKKKRSSKVKKMIKKRRSSKTKKRSSKTKKRSSKSKKINKKKH